MKLKLYLTVFYFSLLNISIFIIYISNWLWSKTNEYITFLYYIISFFICSFCFIGTIFPVIFLRNKKYIVRGLGISYKLYFIISVVIFILYLYLPRAIPIFRFQDKPYFDSHQSDCPIPIFPSEFIKMKNWSNCENIFSYIENGILTINCPDTTKSYYSIVNKNNKKEHFKYKGPVEIKNEFIIAYCENNFNFLTQHLPNYNNFLVNSSSILYKFNVNFVIILLDGISSAHFKRRLLFTQKYLSTLHNYEKFEFTKFNILGKNSEPNLMALLYGTTFITEIINKNNNLINYFRKKGYVTMYSNDECRISYQEPKNINFKPDQHFDHVFYQEFCNEGFFPYDRSAKFNSACFGGNRPHNLIFNYTLQYFNNYNIPKFALLITNTGHDRNMELLQTIDMDLINFFENLKENLNKTITILLSDHGLHYGNYPSTPIGMLEHKLPYLNIIIPKWILKIFPDIKKSINFNKDKLTTISDLHITLKHFIDYPNNVNYDSLLYINENVTKTCKKLNIPPNLCSCDAEYINYGCTIDNNWCIDLFINSFIIPIFIIIIIGSIPMIIITTDN
jgi:hypothetical protein